MKIFISQPMGDRTDEQIIVEREAAIKKLKDKYGQDIEILDTIFDYGVYTHPLVYLGHSIEVLAQADLAYFISNWDEYRGCCIEYKCATAYGIKIEEEE